MLLEINCIEYPVILVAGLMPYNYICVETGCLLSQLTNIDDIFSVGNMLKLATVACLAIVPGLLLKKYHVNRRTSAIDPR